MNVYRVEIPPQRGAADPTFIWTRLVRALTEQAARDHAIGRYRNTFGHEPDPHTVISGQVGQ